MDINNIIDKMLIEEQNFPSFLACYDFGRGLFFNKKGGPHIVASRNVTIWRVVENKLSKNDKPSILFDGENYIIEWQFDYVLHIGGEARTERFFFHWKGMNATKGFSPLPNNINEVDALVDRIYQWGEPPIFFQVFPEKIVVLSGKEENFNSKIPHLLMARGEIMYEIHLFEVPCNWTSFRSQTAFFLIVPNKNIIYIWVGLSINKELLTNLRNNKKLYSTIQNIDESWKSFQFVEVNEGDDETLKEVLGDNVNYLSTKNLTSFTRKLFYLSFDRYNITAVEIKNPLRHPNIASPFPCLQSHLYTAPQPAIFVFDNYNELWLWKGLEKQERSGEDFGKQVTLATNLVSAYVDKIKESRGFNIIIHHATAGQEPIEFTNLFPYWKS